MTTPLDIALADIGYTEQPPGSNRTKFGERFFPGQPSPWCAEMVSCDTTDAGGAGPSSASVGFYRNQGAAQGRLVDLAGAIAAINRGQCVAVGFEWEHDSWPDHMGWLLGVNLDGTLHTVEGNAPGPDHTDEVANHTRPQSLVAFYCVVDIGPVGGPAPIPPPPPPPIQPPHPSYPALPGWMFLCAHPNGRRGFTNHGDKVGVYQAQMARRGWRISADGVFGPVTDRITRQFQTEKHLGTDGIVGQVTWQAAFTLPVT